MSDKDVDRGRIRVLVDGLRKLEMRLPIELPSGEVISVDLEYEKLEKHCFICYSLCHEKDTCPLNRDKSVNLEIKQGISQKNTLRKLEEHRYKHDTRHSVSVYSRERAMASKEHQEYNHRSVHSRLQDPAQGRRSYYDGTRSFTSRKEDRGVNEERWRVRDRSQDRDLSSHHSFPSQRGQEAQRKNYREVSSATRRNEDRRPSPKGHKSLSSRTPPPRPAREAMVLPVDPALMEVNSQPRERVSALGRIDDRTNRSNERVSALERLEERDNHSTERVSALERIEPPSAELQRATGLSSSLLERLQDVEIQYDQEEQQLPIIQSPITQQESQRTPASLRLGPLTSTRKKNP
ncbi:unnamed protein product, partial [Brassica rapa subsp. narinosa]